MSIAIRSGAVCILVLAVVASSLAQEYLGDELHESTNPVAFAPVSDAQPVLDLDQQVEDNAYLRVDYFYWNEATEGKHFLREDGALWTFGRIRQRGLQRSRLELFASKVHYNGVAQFPDHNHPLQSHTNYFGVRGEYELQFEPETLPALNFFGGLGTRFWLRDLPDAELPSIGEPVHGYLEAWWTLYPYVGVQKRRNLTGEREFFYRGLAGLTAFTLEHAFKRGTLVEEQGQAFVTPANTTNYPRLGVTAQLEAGIRGPLGVVSAYAETMYWGASATVRDTQQPDSILVLVGLRAGITY